MCPVCQGNVVPVEGQCCGDCRSGDIQFTPGCEVNGTVYNVGKFEAHHLNESV